MATIMLKVYAGRVRNLASLSSILVPTHCNCANYLSVYNLAWGVLLSAPSGAATRQPEDPGGIGDP